MLGDKYNPQETEKKLQDNWYSSNIHKWNESEPRANNFVIDTPPPTVSGLLHMGHVFSYTQTDFVARYMRMKGMNVYYPMGFDDNGLPTERLVEKIKEIRAVQMHREDFKNLCKEVVKDAEEQFRELFKSLALSVDWSQEYQTINPDCTKISQMSFLDLLKNGYIDRRNAPTFWDPVDRTAIAQAEIEDKERNGVMNDIDFALESGDKITIATTRPELIAACVAVFYHPDDERYNKLAGKFAVTPVYGAKVPLLPDVDVAIDKGTGLVMCCTFGDIQDIEWWKRHKLIIKSCITLEGKMQNAGELDGLYVKEARAKMIEKLKEMGLLTKQDAITQFVKCAERSGAPLEIISSPQWYIKLLDYKEQILAKARECNWFPDYMRIRLENWVNGLNQDWCISRQRYFGVPFPIWYSKREGEEGKILVPDIADLPIDPSIHLPKGYSKDEVTPDMDVMDTWATSSVTPQLNSKAITEEFSINYERHQKLYPADIRPQAHEIIRTWAFYTIVKSLYHENSIPWKNLMISGWCLAADKTKMSKSKGNVVTPTALIQEKGTDVVRYWASNSKLGVDIAYSEEVFKIGSKLINKLWNASKFVSIHLSKVDGSPTTAKTDISLGKITETLDKWILSRLHKALEKATIAFEVFEYNDARVAIEDFFWNDLCDNYLEMVKVRVYGEQHDNQKIMQSSIYTIHHILKTIFRLFAPFLPHISDHLNSGIFGEESVHTRGSWPKISDHFFDANINSTGYAAVNILELVRKFKSDNKMSLKTELTKLNYSGVKLDDSLEFDLKNAANALRILSSEISNPTLTAGDIKIEVEVMAS